MIFQQFLFGLVWFYDIVGYLMPDPFLHINTSIYINSVLPKYVI